MNKWQIICPVVAIAIAAIITAIIKGQRDHNYFIQVAYCTVAVHHENC